MFIMLLAADSGGFGTLTMFLRSERFSVFIGQVLETGDNGVKENTVF